MTCSPTSSSSIGSASAPMATAPSAVALMTVRTRGASHTGHSAHVRRSTSDRLLNECHSHPCRGISGYRTRVGLPGPFESGSTGPQRSRYGSTDNHSGSTLDMAQSKDDLKISTHGPRVAGNWHRRTRSCADGDSNRASFVGVLAPAGAATASETAGKRSASRLLAYLYCSNGACEANHVCISVNDDTHVPHDSNQTVATFKQRVCNRLTRSNWARPIAVILAVASVFASLFALLYVTAPSIPANIKRDLKLPRSIDQLKSLATAALHISHTHFPTVAGTYLVAYTFLQTFCVPGSLFMTVLGGALFPLPLALGLVATCSAVGASVSFLLSAAVGKSLVDRYFEHRLANWSRQVAKQRHQLFNYIVFLRVAPLIPNWFINLSSPHLQVPLSTFFLATFFGVLPPSFVYARLGSSIQELTSKDFSFWNPLNVIAIAVFCTLAAVPILLQRYRKRHEVGEEYAPLNPGHDNDLDEGAEVEHVSVETVIVDMGQEGGRQGTLDAIESR